MALPKAMRLKGHRTFDYIHKNSVKYYGKLMTFKIAKSRQKNGSENSYAIRRPGCCR